MSHRSGIPVTPELDKAISETRAGKYRLLQVLFLVLYPLFAIKKRDL